MTNTAQFFCINDRSLYSINSLELQLVILEMTASAAFGKQKSNQNITLLNPTFYNLSADV